MSTEKTRPVTPEEIEKSIADSRARRASVLPKPRLSTGEVSAVVAEILEITGAGHVRVEHKRRTKRVLLPRGLGKMSRHSDEYTYQPVLLSKGGKTIASVKLPGDERVVAESVTCHVKDLFQKRIGYGEAVARLLEKVKRPNY